ERSPKPTFPGCGSPPPQQWRRGSRMRPGTRSWSSWPPPARPWPSSYAGCSPDLRRAVGDDRAVLVGFDRGGWSPALFAHMHAEGFDVLTWRKAPAENLDPDLFTDLTYTDETGRVHAWRVADTTVDLPIEDEQGFTMRQVTLIV